MEFQLTSKAIDIINKRYLHTFEGKRETIQEWIMRICNGITKEITDSEKRQNAAQMVAKLLNSGRAIFNTPTMMNAGLPNGQLAACFALPISDDMGRKKDGIFSTLRDASLIQQTGGGIGFDWSDIRPAGDIVSTTGGSASGPISFLSIYDKAFTGVQQGGCLLPETLVFTNYGLLRLDEIADVNVAGWTPTRSSIRAMAYDGYEYKIATTFNNGKAEVIELTTANGIKICGTHEHKISVPKTDGTMEWKRLGELKESDEVIFKLGFYHCIAATQYISDMKLDEYLAFVIGYLSSHETIIRNGQLIVGIGGYYPHTFIQIFSTLFSCPITHRGVVLVMPCPQVLNNIALFTGVPPEMRKTNGVILSYYIQGLFMDQDSLKIYVQNEHFAQELATIIIGLGWMPEITLENGAWSIELYKNDGDICNDRYMLLGEFAKMNPATLSTISVQIRKIAKCTNKCLTLDLSVDKVHCYIANGISVHNSRRGANMGVMRIDHPDIEKFITCKSESENVLTCFNLSVAITDKFMEAVGANASFDLINPHTHAVSKTVNARELMRKISTNAWKNGEPGVIFIDHINAENAMSHKYQIAATNPCVPADTIVITENGPRTVAELIGKPFNAVIDGRIAPCRNGFFSSGIKDVYCLQTDEGYCLKLTRDHHVLAQYKMYGQTVRKMIAAEELCVGDKIIMNDNNAMDEWGECDEQQAALAFLLGFHFMNGKDEQLLFTQDKYDCMITAFETAGITDVCITNKTCATSEIFAQVFHSYFANDNARILTESSYFQTVFIRGALESAKCTAGGANTINYAIETTMPSRLFLIQHLLINLGIFSSIVNDALVIEFANINRFYHKIGSMNGVIRQNGCKHREFLATFKSLTLHENSMEVFDCTVENLHMFSANSCKISNCGEIPLGPYENCCLGHINLAKHAAIGSNVINWVLLEQSIRELVRSLNMIIDANAYVPAIPQLKDAALDARRIGLGITGLADLFMMNGIAYGSVASQKITEHIISFIRVVALRESAILAKEDGAFPAFDGSLWSKEEWRAQFVAKLQHAFDAGCIGCGTYERGVEAIDIIKQYGVRNSSVLTVAPTGTTSLILGVEGYGCEPIYSLSYKRKLGDGTVLTFCSDIAKKVISQHVDGAVLEDICAIIGKTGCVPQDAPIPQAIRDAINATALRVPPAGHLAIQAVLQKWVDNSISKTVNCPNETTIDDIEQIYTQGWKMSLKGIAVYRDGSRQCEVLSENKKGTVAVAPSKIVEKKRPLKLHGATYRCEANFGYVYTTVNVMESIPDDNREMPFEVFINVGKSGSDIQADSEAIGRLISAILRMNSDIPIAQRVETIISQLRGIGGARQHLDSSTKTIIHSLPDAIALTLEEFIKEDNKTSCKPITIQAKIYDKDICPECGCAAMVRMERCQKCENCGYAAC